MRYCRFVTEQLGDLFDIAITQNEPNLRAQLAWSPTYPRLRAAFDAANKAAAKAEGSDIFASPTLSDWKVQRPVMIEAHNRARAAIRRASGGRIEVGFTLSLPDDRAPPSGASGVERKRADYVYPRLAADYDFVGVQNYTYNLVGPNADLLSPENVELTQNGYPLAPETLGNVIRMVLRAVPRSRSSSPSMAARPRTTAAASICIEKCAQGRVRLPARRHRRARLSSLVAARQL